MLLFLSDQGKRLQICHGLKTCVLKETRKRSEKKPSSIMAKLFWDKSLRFEICKVKKKLSLLAENFSRLKILRF